MSKSNSSQRFVSVRLGSKILPGCATVFAVFATTFLLSLVPGVDDFIDAKCLLVPELAIGRQPWRLLTAPLIVLSPFALVFIGLLLWSIGAAIEQRIKARRFVAWSAAVLLTASLTVALLGRLHALTKSAAGQLPIPIEGAPIFGMVLLGFAQLYGGLQVRMWGVDQLTSGRTLAGFFIAIGLVADVLRGQWELLGANLLTLALTFVLLTDHGGQSVWSVWKTLRSKLPSKGRRPRKFEVIDGGGGGGGGDSSRHNHDSARKWLN